MKIAVYGRQFNDPSVFPYVRQVFDSLTQHNVEICVHPQLKEYLQGNIDTSAYKLLNCSQSVKKDIDVFLTLGGDGTLLDMVTQIRDSGIPVIGINFGRLGFLASINKSDIAAAIHAVVNKEFTLDSRELLVIDSEEKVFGDDNFALNDVTIHKRDDSAMITTHVSLDGEFLNSYWGDGIIISTPTGSTAYSLSCNGPIMFPQSNSIALTPVAPHNLNVRPVVLPDTSTLTVDIDYRGNNYIVSCDSRTVIMDKPIQFKVYKAGFKLNLIRLNNESYLSTLRKKLLWGLDARNY
ncbi:NAD kinase [Mucilaginibacter phyllosphaerae]|uniref:NAD kinase n=1 Tax=Mucilaginibacter phyllosphaerae TaxID=1812349 RepID=A0A4Y8AJH5_9SPHI|nr:NAD kinase [Mucilaginibacter phyllosphaerae]MBB3967772.1 NAD+ kinase [Mucilaginibacter phyllosphaerae]TEW69180.1 NAD kinase [Mucilaginibacter phyllosphaerae]GGH03440.1 NAD kinase [Mucilaginibacter phyllosphaerae]